MTHVGLLASLLPKPEPQVTATFYCSHCDRHRDVRLRLKLVRMIANEKAHMACDRCARFMSLEGNER